MSELNEWIHPGLVIGLGGLLIPFIPWRRVKQAYFFLLPVAGLVILAGTSAGVFGTLPPWPAALHKWNIPFLHYTLDIARINKLSILFGYVYLLAAFCMNIYALRAKSDWEHVAAMIYVGSALGAVFAGDLFTLFFCLEIMSWAPFFLILLGGTKSARGAALRYILWHHFSGVCILAGILMHVHQTGSIAFVHMPWGWGGEYTGYNLMLLGFIINAATAPFHSWLADTYSEATPSGSVYMTAYTTKTAVFCLIVTFSGVPLLMWMGVISAMFSVFMAVLENDGRRLLSYHIVSQVGYMVAGVGIGTTMALNGAAAHAFCHIIYKALLYMGVGCPLVVVGTAKFNQLGGLYKYMPISFWLTMIGGLSISAFPLFSGFVSKTMTIEAAELIHQPVIYLMLECASIGTFLHTGLKLPWNIWLQGKNAPPAEIEAKLKDSAFNSPLNMLIGMAILAVLCILLGVFPKILYDLLPYPVDFVPYTLTRVFSLTQMFIFTFLGFWLLRKLVVGHPTYTLDTDWFVRIPGSLFLRFCEGPLLIFGTFLDRLITRIADSFTATLHNPSLEMRMTPMAIGFGVLMALVVFSIFLVVNM
ncbi:Na(+) H(+) antiporter subunit A [Olavius algarvensis Delta 1 endosymbiont]|nr:Na(+) H(+) antiporter subunit A [Olavius algarvensis Delta 1 endosymbiont]